MNKENEAIVREACRVVWTEGQVDRVDEFYAEDFVADYPNTNWGEGVAGVKALARRVRQGMPDAAEQIESMVSDGDTVVVQLTVTGTHTGEMYGVPPSGRVLSYRDVTFLKVVDGKITEQHGLTDFLSLFMQLGLVEHPGTR